MLVFGGVVHASKIPETCCFDALVIIWIDLDENIWMNAEEPESCVSTLSRNLTTGDVLDVELQVQIDGIWQTIDSDSTVVRERPSGEIAIQTPLYDGDHSFTSIWTDLEIDQTYRLRAKTDFAPGCGPHNMDLFYV